MDKTFPILIDATGFPFVGSDEYEVIKDESDADAMSYRVQRKPETKAKEAISKSIEKNAEFISHKVYLGDSSISELAKRYLYR